MDDNDELKRQLVAAWGTRAALASGYGKDIDTSNPDICRIDFSEIGFTFDGLSMKLVVNGAPWIGCIKLARDFADAMYPWVLIEESYDYDTPGLRMSEDYPQDLLNQKYKFIGVGESYTFRYMPYLHELVGWAWDN